MSGSFSYGNHDRFLSDQSAPFLMRDITRWRTRIKLPFCMDTPTRPVTLSTEADVRQNFYVHLDACEVNQLDLVHNEPIGTEFCEDGTVLATYPANLMRQGKRITAPQKSTALLHPSPEGWKMSAIVNARAHLAWTGRTPTNTGE